VGYLAVVSWAGCGRVVSVGEGWSRVELGLGSGRLLRFVLYVFEGGWRKSNLLLNGQASMPGENW
jgi:hypothetical protein